VNFARWILQTFFSKTPFFARVWRALGGHATSLCQPGDLSMLRRQDAPRIVLIDARYFFLFVTLPDLRSLILAYLDARTAYVQHVQRERYWVAFIVPAVQVSESDLCGGCISPSPASATAA
jgi:hypothetical protein